MVLFDFKRRQSLEHTIEKPELYLYALLSLVVVAGFAAGVLADGTAAITGAWQLQTHPARLVNDFSQIAGPGAALVNATLVAAIALLLIWRSQISLSGPTIAAFFTVLGFGLFGKTPLNVIPIIAGVAISARVSRHTFGEYILIALFGTALGPLVSAVAVEVGLSGIPAIAAALVGGLAAGFFLPPLAMAMLRLHQGYNLYNIGLTSGFLALFAAGVLRAADLTLHPGSEWNSAPSSLLILLIPVLSAVLIASALILGRGKVFADLREITTVSGRLPSDFVSSVSHGGALLNMGVMGIGFWAYVLVVGGDLNGPVLGGILTVIGFASFGKHARNCWPIVVGVAAATLVFGRSLSDAGPLLAVLFGTTLAPLAGEFGWKLGIIAGFIHLVMVLQTGAWHAGISLYNNGFAGGLTAAFLVAIIEWRRTNKEKTEGFRSKRA
ncbi:MAG: DUF1576 domain-containing protein [Spirochaetota bacterium]